MQVEDAVPKETDSTETFPDKGQYTRNLSDFERQQRQIIELWAVCNVPLVHRTYFFLLFKGDPSDYVYMEVELRRLSFLKQTINNDTETSRSFSTTCFSDPPIKYYANHFLYMLSNQDTNGEGTHTREGMAFKTNTKEIPMEPENRTLPKMGRGGELKAEKSAGGVQSVD